METLDQSEARAQRRREQTEPGGGADQREALELHRQRLGVRAVGDTHVHPEILHRRIEELLERRPQAVHFIYKEDVARLERGEHTDEVAGTLEHGAGRRPDVHAELFGHEQRERRLAESRRAEEERVIERLLALLRRIDRDLERLFDLRLADELIEPGRPQRGVGEPLVLERVRRRYFRASHESELLLLGRARQRTGRASASMMWRVWHCRQVSSAVRVPAGTRRRLVDPHRAQIHSAVMSAGTEVIAS